ncbi:hypothetical protein [Providencia hangzhouensis]|uniref:hypothetical protein n=1 Tax=Providencia hangzhouensis TaxID=3031799 RepID=UPI0034DD4577
MAPTVVFQQWAVRLLSHDCDVYLGLVLNHLRVDISLWIDPSLTAMMFHWYYVKMSSK